MPAAGRLLRFLAALALLAIATALALAAPVAAQTPPRLTEHVTDQAGVLGSGKTQVDQAATDLLSSANVEAWILLVPTTGSDTAQQFAQNTFQANGLGGNDFLLVVGVNDHRYGWWEIDGEGTRLSGNRIDTLLSDSLDAHFRAGDYAGGLVAFMNALKSTIAGGGGTTPGQVPSIAIDWTPVLVVLGVFLVICGLVIVAAWFSRRRQERFEAEERDRRTGQLARDANRLLVATDDMLRDADQEAGFAEAEFDPSDVAPFHDALAKARDELKAAFGIRQQLDDEIPEDQPTKERMYNDVISHCQAAQSIVGEQHKRLQALRDLEKSAPQVLAGLPAAISALQARETNVKGAMAVLGSFAPAVSAPVAGNAEEVDKRGAAAEASIAQAQAALAATPPDTRTGAHATRAAQDAIAQANQLLDAIEQQAKLAQDAQSRCGSELQSAETDLKAAHAAAQSSPGTSAPADLSKADALLQTAHDCAAATPPDPIAALKAAQDAHAAADKVLAGIRAAEDARARARSAFDAARASADTSIRQADSFIASRRNGVGRTARTRLVEAQRHLAQAQALAATDLVAATSEARSADQLADQAYEAARQDFDDFNYRGPRGGAGGGGGSGGGGGGNELGALLGGIVLGGILSGGRHGGWGGGGFGGTPWGSGGGWGGGFGGGGGGGFGGFGGGGHGGGGGWGGGGGGGGHGGGGGW